MKKPLLRVLSGEKLNPPPVWLMRQAGRYLAEYRKIRKKAGSFLELCYTPELAVEVTLQPIRRYGFDAAILFSDILVIPDALGREVSFSEGKGPILSPLENVNEIEDLDPERVIEHLLPVYEAVQILAAQIPKKTALIGFAGAPWTVAAYMIQGHGGGDFAKLVSFAWKDPKHFQCLISVLTESTVQHLLAQIKAGADVVMLFDSWSGIAAEPLFRQWCIHPIAEIVSRIREQHPEVPVIGFPRGSGTLLVDYARETKVSSVGLDTGVPLKWAAKMVPNNTVLQGNLDPLVLSVGGPALQVETQRIIKTLSNRPHIFNLGHGIRKETNPNHVDQLLEVIRSSR